MSIVQTTVEATPPATDSQDSREILVPPTPEQLDEHIATYQTQKAALEKAKEDLKGAKNVLIFLADKFGQRPPHAEQSIRLAGLRNAATITRGTTVTVDESAVLDLGLNVTDIPGLFQRLFASRTKHTLVEGARDVLKTIALPRRRHEKILALFGKCIDISTNEPSVKVEVIKPEKPAKQPRAKKAVA